MAFPLAISRSINQSGVSPFSGLPVADVLTFRSGDRLVQQPNGVIVREIEATHRLRRGIIVTGDDYDCRSPRGWPLERSPYSLETRLPGVFVAGDARRGAIHRIVAAAGEGASAVQFTHHYFRDTPGLRARNTEPREASAPR